MGGGFLVGSNTLDAGFEDKENNSGSPPGHDGDPGGPAGSQARGLTDPCDGIVLVPAASGL